MEWSAFPQGKLSTGPCSASPRPAGKGIADGLPGHYCSPVSDGARGREPSAFPGARLTHGLVHAGVAADSAILHPTPCRALPQAVRSRPSRTRRPLDEPRQVARAPGRQAARSPGRTSSAARRWASARPHSWPPARSTTEARPLTTRTTTRCRAPTSICTPT